MSIKIRGKEYVLVAERVTAAHEDEGFNMLSTEHFQLVGHWYCRVIIEVKGKQFIGTAEIKFDAKKDTADGSSPMECAETSALGRALGFAGYGSVESIASADEIVRSQPRPTTLTPPRDIYRPAAALNQGPVQVPVSTPEGSFTPVSATEGVVVEEAAQKPEKATLQQIQSIEKICKKNKIPMPRGLTGFSRQEAADWIAENPYGVTKEPYGFHKRTDTLLATSRLNPAKPSFADLVAGKA